MKKISLIVILTAILFSCGQPQKQEQKQEQKSDIVMPKAEDLVQSNSKIYHLSKKSKVYLLDSPKGNKILNERATNYYGRNTYYQISELDDVKIIEDNGEWVKVKHTRFPVNNGWIERKKLVESNDSKGSNNSDSYENPSEVLSAGSTGYIRKDCAAVSSKDDFEEMCKYVRANNRQAFEQMVLNGKILYLYKGDKITVLENGFGWTKINFKDKTLYIISSMLSSRSSGKYRNAETGERQNRYGGSQQQKDDLKAMEEYAKQHPEFW